MTKLDWSKVPKRVPVGKDESRDDFGIDRVLHGTIFTFGKYKGKRILSIWISDESYCKWIYANISKISREQRLLLYELIETGAGKKYTETMK